MNNTLVKIEGGIKLPLVDTKQAGHVSALAITLSPREVVAEERVYRVPFGSGGKILTREHEDGWVISGAVTEDYYYWVNDFYANNIHTGDIVFGNFETTVYASSFEAYEKFVAAHEPEVWDYYDI